MKIKIRTASESVLTKNKLITICAANDIKITKIIQGKRELTVIFPSTADSEKLFEPAVIRALTAADFTPILPDKLKAQRSLFLFHLDDSIYEHSAGEILEEIRERNSWAQLNEVIKLQTKNSVKIICSSSITAEKIISSGLSLFQLHIPGPNFHKEKYIDITTCYKCYSLNTHLATECDKEPSYKVCSNCSSRDHTWQQCSAAERRCVNCGGGHNAMYRGCPCRKEIQRKHRVTTQVRSTQSAVASPRTGNYGMMYSTVAGLARASDHLLRDTVAKSVTCVVLASLKNGERPGTFNEELNCLLKQNGLPFLNLDGFSPPTPLDLGDSLKLENEVAENKESAFFASPASPKMKETTDDGRITRTASWLNKKVFRAKGTVVKSVSDFSDAFHNGNIIVTESNGNVSEYSAVVVLIGKTKILPKMNELKKSDFNVMVASPARFLKSRNFKS